MKFDREVHEHYQIAYALARKNLLDKNKQRLPACPAACNTLLDEKLIPDRMDLGVLDIPTSLIVGVAEETEQTMLYTKNFLPVSAPNSEFADVWRALYHILDTGAIFDEAIICIEYLAKFYVVDGMKRVSVSMYFGAGSIKAHVIRILPDHADEEKITLYLDFLLQYRLTKLYQLQFTQPGFFEKLQRALGRSPSYRWSDSDREKFLRFWPSIEHAFRKSYEDSLRISSADALVILMNKYSIDQIASMDSWMLARVFQAFWKEFYTLSFPDKSIVHIDQKAEVLQTA